MGGTLHAPHDPTGMGPAAWTVPQEPGKTPSALTQPQKRFSRDPDKANRPAAVAGHREGLRRVPGWVGGQQLGGTHPPSPPCL